MRTNARLAVTGLVGALAASAAMMGPRVVERARVGVVTRAGAIESPMADGAKDQRADGRGVDIPEGRQRLGAPARPG